MFVLCQCAFVGVSVYMAHYMCVNAYIHVCAYMHMI